MAIKKLYQHEWGGAIGAGSMDAVKKSEVVEGNLYEGTRQQLIDAGVIRPDQFPPLGQFQVSYRNGDRVDRNCRKDENFLRVWGRDDAWVVLVGVPIEMGRARKAAWERERAADRRATEQKSRSKASADAKAHLDMVPKTAADYLRSVAASFRNIVARQLEFNYLGHGYSIDPDSAKDILIACDGVIEQIMAARARLDVAKQTALVFGLQSKVVAGQAGQAQILAQLTRPNPAILEGGLS